MTTPSPNASVQVGVSINAQPETVWSFLSDRDRFLSWMTFIPGSPIPSGSRFEPRVGGELRIIFPDGGEARGSVLEFAPPRRLVITWGYDPDVAKTGLGPGACRVEITLSEHAGGTRVTLRHSGPMSPELAKGHEAGWRHYLAMLAVNSTGAATEARLVPLLQSYFGACNEPDEARRAALLGKCCAPAVRVRSAFACCDNVEELSAHIANGLRHMPGCAIEQHGAARHMHGVVRVPWRVRSPDGRDLFAGENVLALSPAGLIEQITGFPA